MTQQNKPTSKTVRCPNCNDGRLSTIYEVESVPVQSVLLVRTREEAVGYPRGRISLAVCHDCGFVHNSSFDPSLVTYNQEYEETQGFSDTFRRFHQSLAERLIDRYGLQGKRIIEIGCGKGEFLTLLCELGGNTGVGFDPSFVPERLQADSEGRISFVVDFYSERYRDYDADFFCCKMTLEHIPATAAFLKMVRANIGNRKDAVVFFQVPDAVRVLKDVAFWDVYYEHCSYFSPGSLARLFRHCGFEVMNVETDYDGQYLMIAGRPADLQSRLQPSSFENDLPDVIATAERYATEAADRITRWRNYLRACEAEEKRVVVWGGGSKAVAFLTALGDSQHIQYVVDINPFKQGTFTTGTGQLIVAPGFLRGYRPDVVIAMNSVYLPEIRAELEGLGLDPALTSAEGATGRFERAAQWPVRSLRRSA
jgi:SAM-dependent methyltransferase